MAFADPHHLNVVMEGEGVGDRDIIFLRQLSDLTISHNKHPVFKQGA